MTQRMDTLTVDADALRNSLFFNGPSEFLVSSVVKLLRQDKFFGPFFGVKESDTRGFIDEYQRMDYPGRALPALRVYSEEYEKQFESWFIEGDLVLDVLLPAELRRRDLELVQSAVANALLQQFRRPTFFNSVGELVPGTNELGKRFSVNKSLGFRWADNEVPLTQLRANFKIDLRIWDDYLEATLRTKDDPFEPTLGELKRIVTEIQALREGSDDPEVIVPSDQEI